MIARALQFAARHYLNWSAIKLAYFLGALSGMIIQTILVSLVLAGYDLTRLVPQAVEPGGLFTLILIGFCLIVFGYRCAVIILRKRTYPDTGTYDPRPIDAAECPWPRADQMPGPYCPRRVQEHVKARVIHDDRGHETPCWIWQSGVNGAGYATGRPAGCDHGLMHRISYEAFKGPIPIGFTIDHVCYVKNCVNPAHLEAVTQSENTRRAWAAGRLARSRVHALRSHCKRGHEFTPENTIVYKSGIRRCRTCDVAWRAARERDEAARANLVGGSEQTARTANAVQQNTVALHVGEGL